MRLLVSVRSPAEAVAALEGGADLIDVKEPDRGSLGRADDDVIAAVVEIVGGRRPVSAAMGELKDAGARRIPHLPLAYLKWGLAGCRGLPWWERLLDLRTSTNSTVVPCAYADAQRAEAPDSDEVARLAIEHQFPVLLIDTWLKDGAPVFSFIPPAELRPLVERLHMAHVEVALAGSLSPIHAGEIRRIGPDWVAVRGAVCESGNRQGRIEAASVQSFRAFLTALLHSHVSPERAGNDGV